MSLPSLHPKRMPEPFRISRYRAPEELQKALKKRWSRDPHVIDMIAELDRPERINRPELLTRAELDAINREILACRDSFEYAARNYFWIVYENGMDGPFVLWESQELILERMRELAAKGRPQKVQIIKARRLGCSTLIEALIAHQCLFFSNKYGLVVSYDRQHSEYLFSIILHIYDMLPWWLKPECAARKYEEGMHLATRDPEARRWRPGLNSRIKVEYATKMSGVGQGVRVTAAHICLAPSTLVRTSNGELKPISTFGAMDAVLTSRGLLAQARRAVKSRRRDAWGIRLQVWGSPFAITATRDHRVLSSSGWKPAERFRVGDWVAYPIRPIDDSLIDLVDEKVRTPAHFRLAGMLAASEAISRVSDRIVSFHWTRSHERASELAERVRRLNEQGLGTEAYLMGSPLDPARSGEETPADASGEDASDEEPDPEELLIEKRARLVRIEVPRAAIQALEAFIFDEGRPVIRDAIFHVGSELAQAFLEGFLDGARVEEDRDGIEYLATPSDRLAVQARELITSLKGFFPRLMFGRRKYIKHFRARWDINITPQGQGVDWRRSVCGRWVEARVVSTSLEPLYELWDIEVDSSDHSFTTAAGVVHNSEYADYDESQAQAIIEGDMVYALANFPDTFAVLETTAKGSGTYTHSLWKANVAMGSRAEWYPIFLPWFMERSRVLAPEKGWRPEKPELQLRERIKRDWTECDNPDCGHYSESNLNGRNMVDQICPSCGSGTLRPVVLSDEQLCYIWHQRINKAKRGPEALKNLKQELASTPEEAFQLSGTQVFPPECFEFVASTIDNNPIAIGNFDGQGNLHWIADYSTGRCGQSWCKEDHRYDAELPVKIWEWPVRGAQYVVGADPAEGLGGNHDYSVAWVNRIGQGREPDYQVAIFRSNTIPACDFAMVINSIGRLYNNALVSIEYNSITTVGDNVKTYYQYPNLYRWKHPDNVGRTESNKYHWVTNLKTRPVLWQNAVRYLKSGLFVVREQQFYNEMETFQKEESGTRVGAERGSHDDVLFAAMIALYTAHDMEWDRSLGVVLHPPVTSSTLVDAPEFDLTCASCGASWQAARFDPSGSKMTKCARCGSVRISAKRRINPVSATAYEEWDLAGGAAKEETKSYGEL